jgi:hypothetical protein
MSCRRYWREGIVLVERGEPDPHRETCVDCRRAHAARHELVRAIPMSNAPPRGESDWQARVWQQIAVEGKRQPQTPSKSRWWWSLAPVFAACVVLLVGYRTRQREPDEFADLQPLFQKYRSPRIEIISGPVVKRSTSARVGDRVRISARAGDDIRLYRAERLVMRCTAKAPSAECTRTDHGIVAETAFDTPGDYQLVVIEGMVIEPVGSLGADLAPVIKAGGDPQLTDLSIR